MLIRRDAVDVRLSSAGKRKPPARSKSGCGSAVQRRELTPGYRAMMEGLASIIASNTHDLLCEWQDWLLLYKLLIINGL